MDSETSNTDSSRVEAGEGGGLGDFVDVDKKEVLADIGREEIKGVEDGTEVHPEQHSVTLNPIVTETRDAEIHSPDAEADNRATEDDHFSSTHHYPKNDNIRDITEPSVSAESGNIPAFIEKDSTPNVDGTPEIPRVRETAAPSNPDDRNGVDGSKGGFDETPRQLPEELRKGVMVLQCESTAPGGICNVYLVGTAHVSQESCREVQAVIRYLKPQVVFLELCSSRLPMLAPQNLQVPTVSEMVDMWKNRHMNAFGILYSWFLAKVAEKLEVFPGSEFRTAFEEAMAYGAKVTLGDRPVQITLRRTWAKMSLWHKTRFLFCMVFQAIFLPSPEELNKMMREMDDVDMLTLVIQEMSKTFPSLMETLLHERDLYMSSTLLRVANENNSVVAVVGKGHLSGIAKNWKQPVAVDSLLEVPIMKSSWSTMKLWSAVALAVSGVAIVSGLYFTNKR